MDNQMEVHCLGFIEGKFSERVLLWILNGNDTEMIMEYRYFFN